LLPVEFLPPAIFLDDHVGNFVDSFVGGEPTVALQAFAPPPDQVARTGFTRIDNLIVQLRAEGALHDRLSTCPACSASSRRASSPARSSALAICRNSPIDHPSANSKGSPANAHDANVINHTRMAPTAAGSLSMPRINVSTRKLATCAPPPTPGNC